MKKNFNFVLKFMYEFIKLYLSVIIEKIYYLIEGEDLCPEPLVKSLELEFKDKTVVITGSSAGIGKELARYFSHNGAFVVMLCRNREKTRKAIFDIRRSSFKQLTLHFIKCDLNDFESVKRCSEEFSQLFNRKIDYLFNNAGIGHTLDIEFSKQNLEKVFTVNYLSHFLLTRMLLPHLKKSCKIFNTTSVTSSFFVSKGYLKEVLYDCPKKFNFFRIFERWGYYSGSKLALLLHAKEFSKRMKNIKKYQNIKIYSICPGPVRTEIMVKSGFFSKIGYYLFFWIFFIPPSRGIQSFLYALSKDEQSGKCYRYCKDFVNEFAKDDQLSKELWEKSENILKDFL